MFCVNLQKVQPKELGNILFSCSGNLIIENPTIVEQPCHLNTPNLKMNQGDFSAKRLPLELLICSAYQVATYQHCILIKKKKSIQIREPNEARKLTAYTLQIK